jgi:glyoxylase-like metal-dependent hydrolase (beta-lactamase superfamily II)
MQALANGLGYVDVRFRGRSHVIATGVLHGPAGVGLVDPGPSSSLTELREELSRDGIGMHDLRWILLTHIHLDHAGATGTLVAENRNIRVYVHERGAGHLIAPERLLASARRLYGERMDDLWGEFRAVPEINLHALRGGERVAAGAHQLEVAYTPGHASHHVSYFDPGSGLAFVGDTAGIRIPPLRYTAPPTPPPDIDLEAWAASAARIQAWSPDTLFLTHFGPVQGVARHLQELLERLRRMGELVRASLQESGTDQERAARFTEEVQRDLSRHMTEQEADLYQVANPPQFSWDGLARYWRTR